MSNGQTAVEIFTAAIGSEGIVPVMEAKRCTDAKSLYHKYSDLRGT